MAELTATATCVALSAVVEAGGQRVSERLLAVRVGWLTGLIGQMAARVVADRWTSRALDALAAGVGADGRALPSKGWMALRRLGWTADLPEGVYVSDRVRRCVEEEAARALRLAVHRRQILAAVITTWPASGKRGDADWQALRDLLPVGVSGAQIGNRTRQIRAYLNANHGRFPDDLPDLEAPASVAAQALLAAADRQLVTLTRQGANRAVLRLRLPLVERPGSRADWAWHILPFALPATVATEARLCTPTLRVAGHRVRIDLPYRVTVENVKPSGHRVALGLDWGVNTLLTAAIGRPYPRRA